MKRLAVKIRRDGIVEAETIGYTGSECLSAIHRLEALLDATTVDSRFTDDYRRSRRLAQQDQPIADVEEDRA